MRGGILAWCASNARQEIFDMEPTATPEPVGIREYIVLFGNALGYDLGVLALLIEKKVKVLEEKAWMYDELSK